MDVNAATPNLFDVIKQFQQIKVDDYQRTYAWEKDEIEDLFEDLRDCVTEKNNHFFGTLILQSRGNDLATVVDGQQRLTTVFVLVAALRDAIMKLGIDTIPAIDDAHLPVRVIDRTWKFLYPGDDIAVHRFHSNRFLRQLMGTAVMAMPATQVRVPDRDSSMTLAFRKAVKTIRSMVAADLDNFDSKEEKLVRINDFLEALFERFVVLRVVTTNLSESLEIFLTLNNRGLPLGPSDLVRGEIMGHLGNDESEKNQQKLYARIFDEWSEISDNVKEPEVFLRHYLVATKPGKVQKKKVHDKVAERLRDSSGERRKQLAREFWADLIEASEAYSQVIAPIAGESKYYLECLHGLIKSHRIFLLTLIRSSVSIADRDATIRLVYVLAFRWVMSGGNAQKLEDFFQAQSLALLGGREIGSIQVAIKNAADINFDVEKYLTEEGDSSFVGKAILHALNRALARGANDVSLNSSLHLEHIAPQTSTVGWQADLFKGNSALYDGYEGAISSIGNLTLLDQKLNLQAKQKPFTDKKVKYNDSTMKITRDLTEVSTWSIYEIEKRTTWVAEMFENIFHSSPTNSAIVSFADWLKVNT